MSFVVRLLNALITHFKTDFFFLHSVFGTLSTVQMLSLALTLAEDYFNHFTLRVVMVLEM